MDLSSCAMVIPPKYVETLSLYYSHVTNHVITSDGKFLLAAIKAGYLAVFPIRSFLKDIYLSSDIPSPGESLLTNLGKKLKPISLIQISNSLSLQLDNQQDSSQYKLVTGGAGTVQGNILSQSNQLENSWTIKLPSDNTLANAILLSGDRIIIGCSDNNIYIHDKETQKEVAKLVGHQDYLHSLKMTGGERLFSASEDGSVRSWDLRSSKESLVILPFKRGSLERSQFGKWIGALDVSSNGEWLVCGGGPKLSVWHLASGKCVHSVDSPNVTHVAQFLPSDSSRIMFAGNGNQVSTWRMSTESPPDISQVDSCIDNIYSIVHHNYVDYDYNLSSFSGDSFKLELCKNGKYIDSELYVS